MLSVPALILWSWMSTKDHVLDFIAVWHESSPRGGHGSGGSTCSLFFQFGTRAFTPSAFGPSAHDLPCSYAQYITSHYITLHHITSHYITLHHITSHYITLHHITSHYITLHHITSHYITLHHIASYYITLHHITSHYITLHHITSHYITLHVPYIIYRFFIISLYIIRIIHLHLSARCSDGVMQ